MRIPENLSVISALMVAAAGSLLLADCALSSQESSRDPSSLSLTITEQGPSGLPAENAEGLSIPPKTLSHGEALTIYKDIKSLRTSAPSGVVNCPGDSGSVYGYELSFSSPNSKVYVQASGCEDVVFNPSKILIATKKLEDNLSSSLN